MGDILKECLLFPRETVLHWVARSGNASIVANLIEFGSPVAPKALTISTTHTVGLIARGWFLLRLQGLTHNYLTLVMEG